ncbi:MAG: hypothetical protein U9R49_11190 [Bacteroidota bacterium]|nr:hypothetical protein [Bacteroidota bacterium]
MTEPGKLYLLAILAIFLIIPLHAQKKGYSPGTIITLEGDTLTGQVKDRSAGTFTDLYSRIRFKGEGSLLRNKYSPEQILGYTCGDQVFESMPLREESSFFKFRYHVNEGNERVFLKIVSRSEGLTYYHWEYMDGENSYVDYIPLFYRNGYDQMVRATQGALGLKRKLLMAYFQDCQQLVRAIERKKLKRATDVYDYYVGHCY